MQIASQEVAEPVRHLPAAAAAAPGHRLRHLDGLRGVAITTVVLFHVYTNDAARFPYGTAYAGFPPARYGWLGVQLFFLISGFVILMTLENCASIGQFLRRRWLRLFPAMAISSVLILGAGWLLPQGFPRRLHLADVLPGLTFWPGNFWHRWFGAAPNGLEGVFWSLYVEVKFYLVFSAAYFLRGRRTAIGVLLALFGLAVALDFAARAMGLGSRTHAAAELYAAWTGARYYGWFAAGALFFEYRKQGARSVRAWAILVGLAACATIPQADAEPVVALIGALVLALFAASLDWRPLQRALELPPIQFVGFISYPLYLLHDRTGLGLMLKLNALVHWPPRLYALLPLPSLLVVGALASLLACWLEPALREFLASVVDAIDGALRRRLRAGVP